jgi:hypothetical protein
MLSQFWCMLHQLLKLTANPSTRPKTRSNHAAATTDAVKLALPSTVFGELGDHLQRPIFFPTMDAC